MKQLRLYTITILLLAQAPAVSVEFHDVLNYDTTILSSFPMPPLVVGFSGCLHDSRLIVCLAKTAGNKLRFASLDLKAMTMELMPIEIGGLDTLIVTSRIASIAFDEERLWLITSHKKLLTFVRGGDSFRHVSTLGLDESYEYLGMQKEPVILGKKYNLAPLDNSHNTIVQVFDQNGRKKQNPIYPKFDLFEVSYFAPHHWTDIAYGQIAIAHATRYEIKIYDIQLQESATIYRMPPYWLRSEKGKSEDLVGSIEPKFAKAKIDVFSPLYAKGSILSEVRFLADSILAVKIRVQRLEDGFSHYVWDFWGYYNGKWDIFGKDLDQVILKRKPQRIITRADFPPIPDRNMLYFGRDHLVALRYGSGRSPLGKTYEAFVEEEDEFIAKNEPRLVADVYRWKLR